MQSTLFSYRGRYLADTKGSIYAVDTVHVSRKVCGLYESFNICSRHCSHIEEGIWLIRKVQYMQSTLFTYRGRYLADTKGSVYEVQGYYVHFRVIPGKEPPV
jgi:hypothetical protein